MKRFIIALIIAAAMPLIFTVTAHVQSMPPVNVNIELRDEKGDLLPGGSFIGWSCIAFDNEPEGYCILPSEHSWFRESLYVAGFTDRYINEFDALEPNACLVLQ